MASPASDKGPSELALALRTIRQRRGLSSAEVARRMALPLRTYQHFEEVGRPAAARIVAFAAATDSDPAALLLCAAGLSAQAAIACADNKALTIAVAAVEDLAEAAGEDFARLTAAELVAAFGEVRGQLTQRLAEARAAAPAAERPQLTERQIECLRWVRAGKSSADIGVILGLSGRTVDEHIAEACERLQVRTRVQAVLRAISEGYLAP